MDKIQEVAQFIDENILHSEGWDSTNDKQKIKAVNHAERTLKRFFPKVYEAGVPIEHLAEQSVWIIKVDDITQKAEMGVNSVSIDGVSVSMSQKDNSVCPFILEVLNLSEGWNSRRKVARYSTHLMDSNRKGWC